MNTIERLQGCSAEFSPDVVGAVADSVERQEGFHTYQEFLASVGIDSLRKRPLIDIKPSDFDESKALVVHLPMANPLDPNQLHSLGTIAALYPDRRIIAAGNPSGVSYGYNVLSRKQRADVSKGDFRPAVSKLVKYLLKEGVEEIDQVGGSYGANLVIATAQYDEFELGPMVMIEPVSVKKRSLIELARDFKSAESSLGEYVRANGSSSLDEARKDSIGGFNYKLALGRPSNVAASRGMARGKFRDSLQGLLRDESGAKANIAWGTESELCDDAIALGIVHGLTREFGEARVKGLRLHGQKHPLANDRALQSAIVAHFIGLD
jgi:hypothetical protein